MTDEDPLRDSSECTGWCAPSWHCRHCQRRDFSPIDLFLTSCDRL